MKFYKKRWIQSGIILISSLGIVLSVFPSFADDNIDNLKGQTSALESELDGINKDILSLSEEISATEMQVEILNGEIARTSDALVEAEENENEQYENMKSRIKYMYEHGNATLLEMLFSAENMADFINKADFIENLSEYDKTALDDLKNIYKNIEDQKNTLETQQDSLLDLKDELKKKQTELQEKAKATSTNLTEVQAKLEKAKAEAAARLEAERLEQLQQNGDRVFPSFHNEAHMPFSLQVSFSHIREDTDPQEPHRQLSLPGRTYPLLQSQKEPPVYLMLLLLLSHSFSALHFSHFLPYSLRHGYSTPSRTLPHEESFSQRSYLHLHRRFLSGHPV